MNTNGNGRTAVEPSKNGSRSTAAAKNQAAASDNANVNGTPAISAHRHTISLYVANKPGVLIRIALVFARRGYNIDSLVVSESNDPNFSTMNIVASGDKKVLDQILLQLNKLIDVVHASDRTGEDIIQRELVLMKIQCGQDRRTEVLQLALALGCEMVDLSENSITFQVVGETEKIENVKVILAPYGVRELVRTGKVLMARGEIATA